MTRTAELPTTTRAAVLTAHGEPLTLQELPLPAEIEPGAALVRITCTTLCGTDIEIWEGKMTFPGMLPMVLGHEMVGEIVATGPDTRDALGRTPLPRRPHRLVGIDLWRMPRLRRAARTGGVRPPRLRLPPARGRASLRHRGSLRLRLRHSGRRETAAPLRCQGHVGVDGGMRRQDRAPRVRACRTHPPGIERRDPGLRGPGHLRHRRREDRRRRPGDHRRSTVRAPGAGRAVRRRRRRRLPRRSPWSTRSWS
jgi:hypothetical protein